ncbi:hypothetical protein [Acinetobacter gerneri]|jgi:hypothetical protein|nr:hypothetical protein [Acinetobacter gerneri]MCH4243733.1 hypothetical protein [Acinetobacter gerneri]MDV2441687.1 hypothetical protein [Acinetobacter gerneri]
MQWILAFLLFLFMLGVKIHDGAVLDWVFFVVVVGMFLTAIVAVRVLD